jgi:hypothetical protein
MKVDANSPTQDSEGYHPPAWASLRKKKWFGFNTKKINRKGYIHFLKIIVCLHGKS